MITTFGILLWSAALLLALRLAWLGRGEGLTAWGRVGLWVALVLAAATLLFRPHEDIFGGEDPGAYINSGITYGRQQKFFEVDPLLAHVPAEVRPDFYYGHAGYGTTKDACLWVREPERAVVGPHFQPAYPLLIALASRIGNPFWGLYVIPIFTLGLALALRALASLLLPWRLAGLIAFLLFLLNPLTVWHGRCARPEIIAGFMLFGGCALLLNAWQNRRWTRWPDIVLGALTLCLAPFFHITAGFLLIPAAILTALVILRGRDDFLLCPPIALAGLVLFTYQITYVTDYYGVGRFLDALMFRPWIAYLLFAAGWSLLAAGCWLSRRLTDRQAETKPETPLWKNSAFYGWGFAGISVLVILIVVGLGGGAGRIVEHYLYLADFKTFANMVALPTALLALVGWIVWLTGPAERRWERLGLALIVFPAIVFSGAVRDFMMTRYWFIALLPMAALSLSALANWLTGRVRPAWLAVLVAGLIILQGWYYRTQLATTTDYRGLAAFLEPYAKIIKAENGILLGEYSRLAAPLEHYFGIPALGLDNERKDDYSRAESAWEAILRKFPDHPAFFMTPFHAPASDRFDFDLARDGSYCGVKLLQARQELPTRIGEHALRLRLYRMRLKTADTTGKSPPAPAQYYLDGGNMGLRHFANLRNETAVFPADAGCTCGGDTPCGQISLIVPATVPNLPGSNFSLVMALTNPPYFELNAINITGRDATPNAQTNPPQIRMQKVSFPARWMRATGQVLVPPAAGPGYLVLLAKTPQLPNAAVMQIAIGLDRDNYAVLAPEPERWQWHLIPVPPAAAGQWLTISCDPAWNPKIPGFPDDLGILIGHLSFWPIMPGP